MCGIAGLLGHSRSRTASVEHAERMLASLAHRGPDDRGVWSDPEHRVCLGNRRLAILDLSPAGHQPMHSPGRRFVVTFNGEIYNHRELRRRLDDERRPIVWQGTSDTEVLTAAIEAWGIDAALSASVGMFALAIWDRSRLQLTLARDRLGEKPLYYGHFDDTWLFGSELKALTEHPSCGRTIDRESFSTYMALGYVPAPASIYAGIRKVMPGCYVTVDASGGAPVETRYWSAPKTFAQPPLAFDSPESAIDQAEALLRDAVSHQLISDRSLGAMLSGGIDSTCIVSLMRAAGCTDLKTFSIGFAEQSFNEAEHAARIAQHLQTDHTEFYPTSSDVLSTIGRLPGIYDEPFADMSQIPTFLVSQLARGSVAVALSGDGGDELFAGYPRYAMGARMWPAMRLVPHAWRSAAGLLLDGASPHLIDRAFSLAFPHNDVAGVRGPRPAQKLGKLARALKSADAETFYWQLLAPWWEPSLQADRPARFPSPANVLDVDGRSIREAFMLRDLIGYLPDDILAKVDRASMAVGLETRSPFLDHRLVEFALRLPLQYKVRNGASKWLLRRVLDRHVPRALVDRPKMGFCIPAASWLRGPLKSWAYGLVASQGAEAGRLLDRAALRHMLDQHCAGIGDWHQPLWTGLMFLAWANHVDPKCDVTDAIASIPAIAPET